MKKETFWTAAALAGRAACQFLLTLGVVTNLSAADAGLWFLFISLGSVVQFFDLGFSAAILRCASYLHSGARELLKEGVSPHRTEGNSPNLPELKKLLATVGVLYSLISLVVLALAALLGATALHPLLDSPSSALAWNLFALALVPQLFISLKHNFLQGSGSLPLAQALMAIGSFLVGLISFFTLLTTSSLVALCAIYAIGSLLHLITYLLSLRRFSFGKPCFSLLNTLWPNSIRSGVSRLSLAMIYHLPTLLISRLVDIVSAGMYGLSVQVCLFASSISQLPIMAAAPRFYALAGASQLPELRALVCAKVRQMLLLLFILGVGILFVAPFLLELLHAKTTLLPFPLLLGLVLFFGLENHRNNHVLLVGAFNRFPFWKADISTGLILLSGGALVLGFAALPGFIAWMFVCGAACIFWWPVKEGLRQLSLKPSDYFKAIFSRPSR